MKPIYLEPFAAAMASSVLAVMALAAEPTVDQEGASLIFSVTIPKCYRQSELIAHVVCICEKN